MLIHILSQINPSKAIENIANTGLMGAILVLLVWYIIYSERKRQQNIEKLVSNINSERLQKDTEQQSLEKEFREHLKNANAEQSDIIRHNTTAFERLAIVLEIISKKI